MIFWRRHLMHVFMFSHAKQTLAQTTKVITRYRFSVSDDKTGSLQVFKSSVQFPQLNCIFIRNVQFFVPAIDSSFSDMFSVLWRHLGSSPPCSCLTSLFVILCCLFGAILRLSVILCCVFVVILHPFIVCLLADTQVQWVPDLLRPSACESKSGPMSQ